MSEAREPPHPTTHGDKPASGPSEPSTPSEAREPPHPTTHGDKPASGPTMPDADSTADGGLTAPQRAGLSSPVRALLPIFGVLVILLATIAVVNPYFLDPPVFLAFLQRAAPLMILAAGQYFVIVSGQFDLSVGALVTSEVVVAAALISGEASATLPVLGLLVLAGGAVGLFNGLVSTALRVPSFITTLGTMLILGGAVFSWTGGSPKGALSEQFRTAGRDSIEGVPLLGQVPWGVLVLIVVAAVAIVLGRSDYGRTLIATGDNDRAAALSGVRVWKVRTLAFIISGLCATVAAVLLGGYAGVSAQVGSGLEFRSITAVVLGGVVLGGGRGSVVGAMAGALTLEALFTLLNLFGVSAALDSTVEGLIIIIALGVAALRRH